MNRYDVLCLDLEGREVTYRIEASDEAAALGQVLDEHGEDIAKKSPFVVSRASARRSPKKNVSAKRKRKPSGTVDDPHEIALTAEIHPQMASLLVELTGLKAESIS